MKKKVNQYIILLKQHLPSTVFLQTVIPVVNDGVISPLCLLIVVSSVSSSHTKNINTLCPEPGHWPVKHPDYSVMWQRLLGNQVSVAFIKWVCEASSRSHVPGRACWKKLTSFYWARKCVAVFDSESLIVGEKARHFLESIVCACLDISLSGQLLMCRLI